MGNAGSAGTARNKLLSLAALAGVASAFGGFGAADAMGISVFGFDETFENDQDAVDPPTMRVEDGVIDGNSVYIGMVPPGDNSPGGEDWFYGGVTEGGLIEEIPASSATYNTPAARNGSANLGLIYRGDVGTFYSTADGPFGRLGRQTARPSQDPFGYHMDLYLEPNVQPSGGSAGGNAGIPDFWMTNAFQNQVGGGYMGETGFAGSVVDLGGGQIGWRFTDTAEGLPAVDIPAGQWVTLEVTFDEDGQANGNDVQATFRILNADRTAELYNQVLNITTLWDGTGFAPENMDGLASDLGGLRYTWFVSMDGNLDRLIVDNIGSGGQIPLVPEPGSLALLGLPAAALLTRRRRKA